MSKVLVISGHPQLEKSYANALILRKLEKSLNDLEIHRLDECYPDYRINIKQEQESLLAADIIVLQFPFYWYSVPALLKKWIDDVFTFNFAYGPEGDKLKGKKLLLSFTIGGPEDSYQPLGYNHFTIEQLLHPLQQTAYLAGLNSQPPVYSHRMVFIPGVYNTQEEVERRADRQAEQLIAKVNELRSSGESKIIHFVRRWFEQFDRLPADDEFFISHLDENVEWHMPEGKFAGHSGFRDWYAIARQQYSAGCQHRVEQINITPNETGFDAKIRVRVQASTVAGEVTDILVNENWNLVMDAVNKVMIRQYHVDVL